METLNLMQFIDTFGAGLLDAVSRERLRDQRNLRGRDRVPPRGDLLLVRGRDLPGLPPRPSDHRARGVRDLRRRGRGGLPLGS